MPDEQSPDDEQFDWLYSGNEAPKRPAKSADPEETQLIGRQDAPGERQPTGRAPSDDSQPTGRAPSDDTQALASASGPEPTRVLEPAEDAPTRASGGQSFGGSYPAPAGSRGSQQSAPPPPGSPATSQGNTTQEGTTQGGTTQRGTTQAPPRSPTPPQPTYQRPRRPRRRRRWWLRTLAFLIIAWLAFLVAVPLWAWSKIEKVDAEPDGGRPLDSPGTTYLIVGSDSRKDLTKQQRADLGTGDAAGQRTDTIVLLHVPDGDGPNLLLSIPRDSYVPIPGHDDNKINAAYAFGGPKLLVQTVEQATDLRVDDYVELGFTGFVDVVDAVGGITVCPKLPINDPKAGHLKMAAGCHDVDGHTALNYSRSRAFALGDITRALHQREVISQVGSAAASWKTVVLPWRYFRVNKAAAETLTIGDNVSPIDLTRFAWAMAHTSGKDAKTCVVPYSDLAASTSAGSAVVWDREKATRMFRAIRNDNTSAIRCRAQY